MTIPSSLRVICFTLSLLYSANAVCCLFSSMPSMNMQMPMPPPPPLMGGMQGPYYNYELNNPLGTGSAWAASGGLIGNLLSFIAG